MNLYPAINHVMNRFDFEKTHRVMEFLDWRWNGPITPTIDELKSTALQMLDGCVHMYYDKGQPKSGMLWATGGFQATVQVFEDGEPRLSLVFYVDETSSNGEF